MTNVESRDSDHFKLILCDLVGPRFRLSLYPINFLTKWQEINKKKMERSDLHHSTFVIRHSSFLAVLENKTLTWEKYCFKVHFKRFLLKSFELGC